MAFVVGVLIGKYTFSIGRDEEGFFCNREEEGISGFGVKIAIGKLLQDKE